MPSDVLSEAQPTDLIDDALSDLSMLSVAIDEGALPHELKLRIMDIGALLGEARAIANTEKAKP